MNVTQIQGCFDKFEVKQSGNESEVKNMKFQL